MRRMSEIIAKDADRAALAAHEYHFLPFSVFLSALIASVVNCARKAFCLALKSKNRL